MIHFMMINKLSIRKILFGFIVFAFLAFIITIVAILIIAFTNSSILYGLFGIDELNDATAIKMIGYAAIKYQLCNGIKPNNMNDLMNSGMFVMMEDGKRWVLSGDAGICCMYNKYIDIASLSIPEYADVIDCRNGQLIGCDGKMLPPLVELRGISNHSDIVDAQACIAKTWYLAQKGIFTCGSTGENWFKNCDQNGDNDVNP